MLLSVNCAWETATKTSIAKKAPKPSSRNVDLITDSFPPRPPGVHAAWTMRAALKNCSEGRILDWDLERIYPARFLAGRRRGALRAAVRAADCPRSRVSRRTSFS